MRKKRGYKIVLTADRILMADYNLLYDAMVANAVTSFYPEIVMKLLLARRIKSKNYRANKAPLGIRIIESVILNHGYVEDEVIIAAPEDLKKVIGSDTKAVIVSSGDPLGIGFNDSTLSSIWGGKPFTGIWYERMMKQLKKIKNKNKNFKIIAGGPGSWQFFGDTKKLDKYGIDILFEGYAEKKLTEIIDNIINDTPVNRIIKIKYKCEPESIPNIKAPSNMGVVEISRGCGLGCDFCTIKHDKMIHYSVEKILKDIKVNVENGVNNICIISEDFLRYGADGRKINPSEIINLLKKIREIKEVNLIQLDHVNVSSILAFSDEELLEIRNLLTDNGKHDFLWVNLGVESLSGSLLHKNGWHGKLYPYKPIEWYDVVLQAVQKLSKAGFIPLISLIFGIDNESVNDLQLTYKFVKKINKMKALIYPVFNAPIQPGDNGFLLEDMTKTHWDILKICYQMNFKWLPILYCGQQKAGKVNVFYRAFLFMATQIKRIEWNIRYLIKSNNNKGNTQNWNKKIAEENV